MGNFGSDHNKNNGSCLVGSKLVSLTDTRNLGLLWVSFGMWVPLELKEINGFGLVLRWFSPYNFKHALQNTYFYYVFLCSSLLEHSPCEPDVPGSNPRRSKL